MVCPLQGMTQEGWVKIYEKTSDSWSKWSLVYWLALQVFGGFFVVNLATAVMFSQYIKAQEDVKEKMASRRARCRPKFIYIYIYIYTLK